VLPLWRLRLIFVSAILLVVPAVCAAPEGVLHYVSGTTVDGTTALEGMRISIGQHVHTPAGHFSELLTHGSTLRVLGNASLEFDGALANLVEGGVALSTSSQFPVHCACATVAPVNSAKTRYTVQLQQKTVYVAAEEGDLLVKSQRKSKTVPAGKTAAVLCGAAAQDILLVGSDISTKVFAGSVAASVAAPMLTRQNVSGESPDR